MYVRELCVDLDSGQTLESVAGFRGELEGVVSMPHWGKRQNVRDAFIVVHA